MAKIFTTEGTGASQVLNEADNNKLKVYDDYDSIDTTELVDGEIVSTKETAGNGSNVYDYINEMLTKENLLSEWEAITIPTSAETAMTMMYDGYITCVASRDTSIYMYVDGHIEAVSIARTSEYAQPSINAFPFKKGQSIYVRTENGSLDTNYSRVAYYKQRYYGGRN